MDRERFVQFRSDFVKFIELIKKGNDLDCVLKDFVDVSNKCKHFDESFGSSHKDIISYNDIRWIVIL